MADILIIDDDIQLSAMLKQLLERQGYSVITASDGNEGISLFHEKGARLIITDLIMPVKEGIETIAELVKSTPDVKIIAISGGGRLKPDSYLNLATLYFRLEQYEVAEGYGRRAIELLPGDAQAEYNFARIMLAQGKRSEARTHLGQVLKIEPSNMRAQKLLKELAGSPRALDSDGGR